MIWIIAIVALIGACIAVAWFRGRHQVEDDGTISLASRVLRHPERILIDLPQVVSRGGASEGYTLLFEAEAELGHVGALQMRRQLLISFAEVFKAPSKESVKKLTDFLFHTADEEFQKTLLWEERCRAPVRFLRLLHAMIESVESGRPMENTERLIPKPRQRGKSKRRKRGDEIALDTLNGKDRDVGYEWRRLFLALSEVVSPEPPPGRSKPSRESRAQQMSAVSNGTSGSAPALPTTLVDPGRAPHLGAFQKVAREVCAQYVNLTRRNS